tara:strand:- start:3 stop:311 length:309 start_codon:yes stop_codon:yes gene_type:complete
MDLEVISCRRIAFVNGKTYPKMCFTCWHVPKNEIQIYNEDDSIKEIKGPFFDHKHLNTAKEMVAEGMVDTLKAARASIKAVREACKGMKKPITHKRPPQEFS